MKKRIISVISVLLCILLVSCAADIPATENAGENESVNAVSVPDTENSNDIPPEADVVIPEYALVSYNTYDEAAEKILNYFVKDDNADGNVTENDNDISSGTPVQKDYLCGAYANASGTDFFAASSQHTNTVKPQKIVYDENFIFVLNDSLNGSFITVFSVSNGKTVRFSKTDLPLENTQSGKYTGMFLHNGILYVLRDHKESADYGYEYTTYIHIFKVTKNGELEKTETFVQTGSCSSVQLSGDKLYITTGYSIPDKTEPTPGYGFNDEYGFDDCQYDEYEQYETDVSDESSLTKEDIIAALPVSGINGGTRVTAENIYFPNEIITGSFLVITGFGLNTYESNTLCVADGASKIYAADDQIFRIKAISSAQDGYYMDIDRFTFENGVPVYTGSTRVDGRYYSDNAFNLCENQLRIALVKDEKHGFAVLDENLTVTDELYEEIQYDNITDVRFTDNSAEYVEIDIVNNVLLKAAFSDNGEIKNIPVSNSIPMLMYTKAFGKGQILGFGTKTETDAIRNSLSLVIYDNSDPADITETAEYNFGEKKNPVWTVYNVIDTIVINEQRDIITVTYSEKIVLGEANFKTIYCIEALRYADGELVSIGKFEQEQIQINSNTFYAPTISSVISGGYIYVIVEYEGVPSVYSYTATDFTLTDTTK